MTRHIGQLMIDYDRIAEILPIGMKVLGVVPQDAGDMANNRFRLLIEGSPAQIPWAPKMGEPYCLNLGPAQGEPQPAGNGKAA